MKSNFKLQMIIAAILLIAGLAFSLYLSKDIFYNLAWTLIGIIFLINPVYPKNAVYLEEKKAKKGIRIAAAIIIFIGLTNGFGV